MGSSSDGLTVASRTGDEVEVAVIGAGQAGLAMGHFLRRQGRRFVILDRVDSIELEHQESNLRQPGQTRASAGTPAEGRTPARM